MDIHEFYDSTFDQFLDFMKPNELKALIHDMGIRVFNNEMIQNKDYRTNIMWTRNGNFISSYDIYPSDLTFPSQENAEEFIDLLNQILDTHPGYIELDEFYNAYNNRITSIRECLKPSADVYVSRIITNPVDTVVGFLIDKDIRIDKVLPTKGITVGDKIYHKWYHLGQYGISFDDPVDISKEKVAFVHSKRFEEESKKSSRRKKK